MNEPRRVNFKTYIKVDGGGANPYRWVDRKGWLLEFSRDDDGTPVGICETEYGTLHEVELKNIDTRVPKR